jgi:hypothetical protein
MCYSATKIKYDFLIKPYYHLPINIDMSIIDIYIYIYESRISSYKISKKVYLTVCFTDS